MKLTNYQDYEIETLNNLRTAHPDFFTMDSMRLKFLWEEFSECRAAGWLDSDDQAVKEFINWINLN